MFKDLKKLAFSSKLAKVIFWYYKNLWLNMGFEYEKSFFRELIDHIPSTAWEGSSFYESFSKTQMGVRREIIILNLREHQKESVKSLKL